MEKLNKKQILITIVAAMFSTAAYSQEPTTVKAENLNGNVLSVAYSKYIYNENFGEPTEGELIEQHSMSFDEQGRSVLVQDRNHFYVMEYSVEDGNKIVTVNDSYSQNKNIFIYDSNNVLIKRDYFEGSTLAGRLIASNTGDGVYVGKIYNTQGVNTVDFRNTYRNGLLVLVENNRNNRYDAHQEIRPLAPGLYTYDNSGRILTKVFGRNGDRMKYFDKYSYNSNGDIVKKVSGTTFNNILDDNDAHSLDSYDNYRYDEHGNWIYRTVGSDRPRYIEKRQIMYRATGN